MKRNEPPDQRERQQHRPLGRGHRPIFGCGLDLGRRHECDATGAWSRPSASSDASGCRSASVRPMPISRFVPISLFVHAASVGMVFALLPRGPGREQSLDRQHRPDQFRRPLGRRLRPGRPGTAADRGKGRELMVGAMVVGSLGAVGFALGDDVWQLVAARAISGAALGVLDPAAQALVTTRDPDRRRRTARQADRRTAGFLIDPGSVRLSPSSATTTRRSS